MRSPLSPSIGISLALVLAVACGSDRPVDDATEPQAPGGSIAALRAAGTEVSLITAQSAVGTGPELFTFGLITSGGELITEGTPEVFVARDERSAALGPFPATFHEFTAFERFPNEAPRTPLTGFFAVEIDVPEPGNWLVAGVAEGRPSPAVGTALLTVAETLPGAVGTEALRIPTPVAHTDAERREICTREPPDPMHDLSLDDALSNGKPAVVNFGTPLLCESRMCGPVVDEVLAVYEDVGADRANFIHVEVYPTRDQTQPAQEFLQWGFQSEPVTLVIDRDGIIRHRFEGPVTADLLREALDPLR